LVQAPESAPVVRPAQSAKLPVIELPPPIAEPTEPAPPETLPGDLPEVPIYIGSEPLVPEDVASVSVKPEWEVDFDAELASTPPPAAPRAAADAVADGDMVWDLDDAFGGTALADSDEDGFTGFHVDAPDEDETVARLLALAAPRDETEDERTARKLARVVVQDVMLYNTKKIETGFKTGNLGDPLLEDILLGAAHYKAKVAPELFPKHYYWDALVELLAKNRPELLSTIKLKIAF
jgi:hypothetical protein